MATRGRRVPEEVVMIVHSSLRAVLTPKVGRSLSPRTSPEKTGSPECRQPPRVLTGLERHSKKSKAEITNGELRILDC